MSLSEKLKKLPGRRARLKTIENPDDPGVGFVLQLLKQEPDLKKALYEQHLMHPKQRAIFY